MSDRPPLPAGLMREVRQRCGFGCVLCGFPIYEYDHILGWAKVRRHLATEITLLCDNHHRAKTAGFLPNERVIAANNNPINRQSGLTTPYSLYYSGNEFLINVGSYIFEGKGRGPSTTGQAIRVDGEPLLWVKLEDGHFLLNLSIYDSNERLALQITDNELVLNANEWDIELVGTRLIIREASRIILFDILFKPPSSIIVRRGHFSRNGIELLVTPRWFAILNIPGLFQDVRVSNCYAGIVIGNDPDPPPAIFRLVDIPRDGWDREGAIRFLRREASRIGSGETIIDELVESNSH